MRKKKAPSSLSMGKQSVWSSRLISRRYVASFEQSFICKPLNTSIIFDSFIAYPIEKCSKLVFQSSFALAEQSRRISNTAYSPLTIPSLGWPQKMGYPGGQMGRSQPFTRGNHLASAYNCSQMANGCAETATSQKGLEQSEVPLNFASTRATLKQQSRH